MADSSSPHVSALVIAETAGGTATALTRELLALAHETSSTGPVAALLIGRDENLAAGLIAHGANRVYFFEADADYDSESWLACAEQVALETRPELVLAGHTSSGADLAPRLAFRINAGVATGCTAIERSEARLLFTRACFGGNLRETVSFPDATAVATVRAGSIAPNADTARTGDVVRGERPSLPRRMRVISRERDVASGRQLEDAKVIVSGGRGLEGPEGFRVLESLAQVLDGAVGASRVPCDLGWCPHSWQIGLTGKTVTPDLYFAIGISGAGHHMAGCGNARTIVAINTDREAAIFKQARFGIVGDYRKVVPALVEALQRLPTD